MFCFNSSNTAISFSRLGRRISISVKALGALKFEAIERQVKRLQIVAGVISIIASQKEFHKYLY